MTETDIRNPDLRGILWNWKPVADALPGRCGVSDLDGIIERDGRFLVLETKRPGEKLSVGQRLMLQGLAALPQFTVLVVYGYAETGEIVSYRIAEPTRVPSKQYDGGILPQLVRCWFDGEEPEPPPVDCGAHIDCAWGCPGCTRGAGEEGA